MTCTGSVTFAYLRGGLSNSIIVPPDVVYTFDPIQGDLDNNGVVNIADLRLMAAYFDQPNTTYELDGNNVIDIFDLIIIGTNFGFTYP